VTAGYITCFVEKKLLGKLGANNQRALLNYFMDFIRKGLNRGREHDLRRQDGIETITNSLRNRSNFITVAT
jgi:hypothetical protein